MKYLKKYNFQSYFYSFFSKFLLFVRRSQGFKRKIGHHGRRFKKKGKNDFRVKQRIRRIKIRNR